MHEAEVPVTLQPLGKTVHVLKDTRFFESAILAGVALDYPCGGEGTCGKCRVIVRQGACPAGPAERRVLSEEELRAGYRLACQMRVGAAMTVEIPRTSLLGSHCQILARSQTTPQSGTDPAIRKQYMELLPPDRGRDESDLARIQRVAGPCDADLAMLRQLPRRLREAHFQGTAVLAENRLIDFEPGNTERDAYAVAMDIGTTTLVAALVELHSGRELAVAARLNPQTRFGDDVLSRILHSQQADGLEELQGAVLGAVREMIGEVAAEGRIGRERIYEVTFAGNTTMQQLLLGIDPRQLGEVPFVLVTSDRVLVPAADLGLPIHPLGRAYVLPVIGGFVGGDTVAGIVSTGLVDFPGPTLLVDIGTNGEIVLWANGKLSAASTAAGPAFEGARISQGMRASAGAIEKVVVDGRLRVNVIGDVPAVGLCGSALVDTAAELLRHGVLTREGRLMQSAAAPAGLLPDLRNRLVQQDGKAAFLLASETESGTGRAVLLTQRDFRELQLASGAIKAGIEILLKRAGLQPAKLDAVLVAGGFGNFIRRNNAQRIGLLPDRVPRNRIRYQGNTSLAGARMLALSRGARIAAEEVARRTEHVDLSCDPDFVRAFAEAMLFPEREGC